jgi:hypothetical protein
MSDTRTITKEELGAALPMDLDYWADRIRHGERWESFVSFVWDRLTAATQDAPLPPRRAGRAAMSEPGGIMHHPCCGTSHPWPLAAPPAPEGLREATWSVPYPHEKGGRQHPSYEAECDCCGSPVRVTNNYSPMGDFLDQSVEPRLAASPAPETDAAYAERKWRAAHPDPQEPR